MALVQRDYILRMIEAIAAAIARALDRKSTGDLVGARLELHNATVELLGPTAAMVGMLDTRTAANLVGDPQRITMWARLLHEDAALLRAMTRTGESEASQRRVLELLLEAWKREPSFDDESARVYAEARALVPLERVDPALRAIAEAADARRPAR